TQPPRIDVHQGNPTLRRLIQDSLQEAGFEVLEAAVERGISGAAELGDLLVLDVDSGLEYSDQILEQYKSAERPVLVCGLRGSRELYADADWIGRPFSMDGLV